MSKEKMNVDRSASESSENYFAQPVISRWLINRVTYENPPSFKCWNGLPGAVDAVKWKVFNNDYPGLPEDKVLEKTLPIRLPDFSETSGLKATWLGHATVLVQMNGINFITDPVTSPRVSPISFTGPRRYRPPPCTIEDYPTLDFAVISHNHYDHLDKNTVKGLTERFPNMIWYVPVGLKGWMESRIPGAKARELIWGESIQFSKNNKEFEIVCIPAQHWSLRVECGKNTSLWCGWAIIGPHHKFYYTGDTGFCEDEFRKLGDKYGPFNLAAIPIGCYKPRDFMKSQHINTEEAIEIHRLVKAEYSIGIHWGTYEMGSTEPYDEPRELFMRDYEKAKAKGKKIGEAFTVDHGETWVYPESRS
ncbi:hypothetical protein FO519_008756 [Halicephalobus sp. NKZ332]|nr:hypothetical protein FO519_008756 [Halicephalobus sp. NKZ332]